MKRNGHELRPDLPLPEDESIQALGGAEDPLDEFGFRGPRALHGAEGRKFKPSGFTDRRLKEPSPWAWGVVENELAAQQAQAEPEQSDEIQAA